MDTASAATRATTVPRVIGLQELSASLTLEQVEKDIIGKGCRLRQAEMILEQECDVMPCDRRSELFFLTASAETLVHEGTVSGDSAIASRALGNG